MALLFPNFRYRYTSFLLLLQALILSTFNFWQFHFHTMKGKTILQIFNSYIPWILTSISLILFLRVIETIGLSKNHIVENLCFYGALGGLLDISLAGTLSALLFFLYFLIAKISSKVADIITGIILFVFALAHLALMFYFLQMFILLDKSLFSYSLQEIVFTVRTSNSNFILFLSLTLCCLLLIVFSFKGLRKIKMTSLITAGNIIFLFLCLIFTFFIFRHTPLSNEHNPNYKIVTNKSYHFYRLAFNHKSGNNFIYDTAETQYKNILFPDREFISEDYPLLSKTKNDDVLGAFFKKTDSLPNIVIVLVEGLGNRLIGNYLDVQFMPFLTELASKSLYWDNILSTTERSFGVIPSILASAPHGEKGFAFIGSKVYHLSLLSILGKYDYHSTFFYGQPSWFDNAKDFFNRNGANRIEHAYTYPKKYEKIMVDDYFWGYNDKALVTRTLEVIDSFPNSPRLDVIYTGSMHPPFIISEKNKYDALVAKAILATSKDNKKFIEKYKTYFATTFFTDDAIKMLIDGYKQRSGFENTIFVITGDHNISHIPPESELDRYHVPLIIYSPMLKEPKIFHSVNSHWDIAPTLLAFLNNVNGVRNPAENAFIGEILDTCSQFRNTHPIVLMTSDRRPEDIFFNGYLLRQNNLYKVDEDFRMHPIQNDSIHSLLNSLISDFNVLNKFSCDNNRLVSEQLYYQYANITPIIVPFKKDYHVTEQEEFCNIISQEPLLRKGWYYFDFSAKDYVSSGANAPCIVMEIRNKTSNQSVLWHSLNLANENGKIHFLFSVDSVQPSDDLIFNAYFWNKDKGSLSIISGNSTLYKITTTDTVF